MIGFLIAAYFMVNRPTHLRNWQPELAVWPVAQFNHDNTVTIKGIRDWQFGETEVTKSDYIDRTYPLDDVQRVWFIVEPFGDWDGIAHTMLSFEFTSQPPVVISLEARKEIGENYSATKGLFNQYELLYMWGTERDFLGRRAVLLQNHLYMYPLQISPQGRVALFRDLLDQTNSHRQQPSFYNTLTANCTNVLAYSANRVKPGTIPRFAKARYLTGHSEELLYDRGLIPSDLPFTDIQAQYEITELVKQHHTDPNFSTIIRQTSIPDQYGK